MKLEFWHTHTFHTKAIYNNNKMNLIERNLIIKKNCLLRFNIGIQSDDMNYCRNKLKYYNFSSALHKHRYKLIGYEIVKERKTLVIDPHTHPTYLLYYK